MKYLSQVVKKLILIEKEKGICDALDIDIGHYILEPLGAITIGDSLRSRIYDN